MLISVGAIAILGLTICAYGLFVAIRRLFWHPLAKYPGPRAAAVSSWYLAYFASRGHIHVRVHQWHQIYGPIVRVAPNLVVFNSPSAFRQIFRHNANVCKGKEYAAVSASHAPNTITATDRTTSKAKRKPHLQMWSESNLKLVEPDVISNINTFTSLLGCESTAADEATFWGATVDLAQRCSYLTADVATNLILGQSMGFQKSTEPRWLFAAMKMAVWRATVCVYQPLVHEWALDKVLLAPFYKKILQVGALTMNKTKERVAAGACSANDLMHHFMTSGDKSGTRFNTKELWLEVFLMLGVGTSTTGPTMSTLFFYLLHDSKALARVTVEIRETFGGKEEIMLASKLSSCRFLQACIDETLRLNPALSLVLPRNVKEGGIVIDGESFGEGIVVGTSIYAMHRNPEYFDEPNMFRPQRWMDQDREGLEQLRDAYFPFGIGPRFCVGWRLAYAQLKIALARTLYEYDMRLAPDARCCKFVPEERCTERSFGAYIGLSVSGPLAQFRRRA